MFQQNYLNASNLADKKMPQPNFVSTTMHSIIANFPSSARDFLNIASRNGTLPFTLENQIPKKIGAPNGATVYEVQDKEGTPYIVKFPQNEQEYLGTIREESILSFFKKVGITEVLRKEGIELPNMKVTQCMDTFGGVVPFSYYQKIQGNPLFSLNGEVSESVAPQNYHNFTIEQKEDLAKKIATFFSKISQVNLDEIKKCLEGKDKNFGNIFQQVSLCPLWHMTVPQMMTNLGVVREEDITSNLNKKSQILLNAFEDAKNNLLNSNESYPNVLSHNDLYGANLIYNPATRKIGIIDFEFMAPAPTPLVFLPLYSLDRDLALRVMQGYAPKDWKKLANITDFVTLVSNAKVLNGENSRLINQILDNFAESYSKSKN